MTLITLVFLFLFSIVSGQSNNHIVCYTACIPGRFGCQCEGLCSCNRKYEDCDDGPYGDGSCHCQYGKWDTCAETSPLSSISPTSSPEVNIGELHGTLGFGASSLLDVLPLDEDSSSGVRQIHGALATHVLPRGFKRFRVRCVNSRIEKFLPVEEVSHDLWEGFAGNKLLPGSTPFATSYGGHQFGEWSGQLGDGRVVHLGSLVYPEQMAKLQVALKGSGRTPFSRGGDGRATLISALREFMGSAYLKALGIPTAEVLAVIESRDERYIHRDTWYNSTIEKYVPGILVRLSPSFLRFGTVQIAAKRLGLDSVVLIAKEVLTVIARLEEAEKSSENTCRKHTLQNDQSDKCSISFDTSENAILSCFLRKVTHRVAALIACWMSNGFVHGVLNSDNMSLIGESIDLNVFSWITNWNESYSPNFIDEEGRYAFGNQPNIALWNLERLADALTGTQYVADNEADKSTWMLNETRWLERSTARSILNEYMPLYKQVFYSIMTLRLGLNSLQNSHAEEIVQQFLDVARFGDYHVLSRKISSMGETPFQLWFESTLLESGYDLRYQSKLENFARRLLSQVIPLGKKEREIWSTGIKEVVPSVVFRSNVIQDILVRATQMESENCESPDNQYYIDELLKCLLNPYQDSANDYKGEILERIFTSFSQEFKFGSDPTAKRFQFQASCGAQ